VEAEGGHRHWAWLFVPAGLLARDFAVPCLRVVTAPAVYSFSFAMCGRNAASKRTMASIIRSWISGHLSSASL